MMVAKMSDYENDVIMSVEDVTSLIEYQIFLTSVLWLFFSHLCSKSEFDNFLNSSFEDLAK